MVNAFATTKMSSKGQVVIPEVIRRQLNLKSGSQFVVIGGKDTVILKSIVPPTIDEFDELLNEARANADKAGIGKDDIAEAVAKVRNRQ